MSVVGDVIFKPGQRWTAGRFALCFTMDGDLELREVVSQRLVWCSGTPGGAKLALQEDGNLVIYSAAEKPLWATNTHGNPGAFLRVQPDGTFGIFSVQGKVLWASNFDFTPTVCCRSCGTPISVTVDLARLGPLETFRLACPKCRYRDMFARAEVSRYTIEQPPID